ncbi:OLC1v1022738C1 [Oldenlandia corymbosa var. corymbosa]|uniref:OLC1v1022738C1 n=1 Tax=Oldenlandia corymbosa var. corymbosa TaxID=529605 RepID=A0AAV1BYJ6_OLDCO|nr:OLC1v1022738C1 [Oldenlandia corymbosa var. corymbosa]
MVNSIEELNDGFGKKEAGGRRREAGGGGVMDEQRGKNQVSFAHKVKVKDEDAILDPLRGTTEKMEIASVHSQEEEINLTCLVTDGVALQFPSKEWTSLRRHCFRSFLLPIILSYHRSCFNFSMLQRH